MRNKQFKTAVLEKFRKGPAILLAAVIAVSGIFVFSNNLAVSAETYDETNPELTFVTISNGKQSAAFTTITDYTPKSEFSQGDGKYMIESDAYCIWSVADDCAFGYREYGIGNTAEDTLTIQVDLTAFYGTKGGLYSTASAGLMIRESLDPGSPCIFFHVRENGVYNIWRTKKNGGCANTANTVPNSYPTGLKIEKVGNKYTTYYRTSKSDTWIKESIKYLTFTGTIYAGITGHCSDPSQPFHAEFANLSAKGSGKPDDSQQGGDDPNKKPDIVGEGIPWEDEPIDMTDTLLFETFTDGSMVLGEESVTNPIWKTEYPLIKLEENGNRRWYRDHIQSFDMIGSEEWTDYLASVDLEFEDVDKSIQRDGKFVFYVREKVIDTLGRYDYGVQMYAERQQNGSNKYYIALAKNFRVNYSKNIGYTLQKKEIPNFFGNGTHNLAVRAFDDKITVWLDGEEIFYYLDDCNDNETGGYLGYDTQRGAFVNSKGCIAFYSSGLGLYVDNITVKKLLDVHGGDYDNSISANWDDDIPNYINNY